MYRIGEFAELAQVPVKTLRYYDGLGLLRPDRVDRSTGYRYYVAAQLGRLNRILALKELGLSLREVRSLITDNVPAEQIRALVRRRHRELEARFVRERARLARAAARIDATPSAGDGGEYEIAVRQVGPRLVASIRESIASHEESERLFDELGYYTRGARGRRQSGAVWHVCSPGSIDCEALVVLPSRVEGSARVRVYEVPAHSVASLVYRGDTEFLGAFRAICAWTAAGGLEAVGPKREIYLEEGGPGVESVTEIQLPIASEPPGVQ
jgi:DNA-binding transcriptional MerR regulator